VPQGEEEAAALALNRLVEVGGWDDERLRNTLSDLAAQGEQMLAGTGFDLQDLDKMIARMQAERREEREQEQADEDLPAIALQHYEVRSGDIWQVGEHLLACADAREPQTWQRLLAAAGLEQVDGIFTSPPYANQRSDYYDSIPQDQYTTWWEPLQECAAEWLSMDGSFLLNLKPHVEDGQRVLYVMDLVLAMVRQWDWCLVDEFCWERISAPGAWPNRFKNGFEPVYHFSKTTRIAFYPDQASASSGGADRGSRGNANMGGYYNTVGPDKVIEWDMTRPSNCLPTFGNAEGWGHPAAFPVGLPEFFILAFSKPGDAWIDPFCGSGSTLIAAHVQERAGLGIDNVPAYISICLERLARASGETPFKVETAKHG
jgi:hypothetical protein